MKTCYIAGPYAGTITDDRVVWLARLALEMGMAPVVVHPAIRAGVYGDDNDPDARARGLDAAKAIAEGCDEAWCLYRDDGTMSDGCRYELLHRRHTGGTWAEWQAVARVLCPELLPQVCATAPERKVAPPWEVTSSPWAIGAVVASRRNLADIGLHEDGASFCWGGGGKGGVCATLVDAMLEADRALVANGWVLESEPKPRKVAPPWVWDADRAEWERGDLACASSFGWSAWTSDNRRLSGIAPPGGAGAREMKAAADAVLRKDGWTLPEDEDLP